MRVLADKDVWKFGQENSIRWIADQLEQPERKGVLVADEVGMGKTRVVMSAILSVIENGGTVATIVPPGLLYQWKKEWDDFIGSLQKNLEYSPILLRSYNSLFENADLNFPLSQNTGKWLLLSHHFGPPILKTKSNRKRFSLPVFAAGIRQRKDNYHKGSKFLQFIKNEGWDDNCLDENCSECEERIRRKCQFDIQVKSAAEFLANKRWRKYRNLNDIRETKKLRKFFESDDGFEMLGDILGPIDLLVIDEAHKNRKENSRLNINLSKIINLNDNNKTIAMTATPLELHPEQWKELFKRIGEPYPKEKIQDFVYKRREAIKYPDNREIISNLISSSKCFTEALKPFVTRRLRIKQDEMRKLLGLKNGAKEDRAHPHRDSNQIIKINFVGLKPCWKPSVFALEAIGKAAKGLSIKNDKELNRLLGRLKITDSRYAAGQVDNAKIEKDLSKNGKQDNENKQAFEDIDSAINQYITNRKSDDGGDGVQQKYIHGKLRRIQYWQSIINKTNNILTEHPRIQNVANEIEKIVWEKGGMLTQEKVLVFGTFKKPLRALWDVLNRRAVLRFLDRKISGNEKEPPIPAVKTCLKNLGSIWKEYESIKKDLKRTYSSRNVLKKAIKNGGKRYDSIRERLGDHINSNNYVMTLPGYAVFKGVKKDVVVLLRARLINELISKGETTDNLKPTDLQNKALSIWIEYLESFYDKEEEGIEQLELKTEWNKTDYLNGSDDKINRLKILDRWADNIGKKNLTQLVINEMEHISGRLGFFARLLDGDVKMETRRVLQAQFNTKASFPQVLIAQSQVGREGLNLHKACRTIIQFHSEWNPGVIEQQIGRVDRIESFWQELASYSGGKQQGISVFDDGFPKIIIKPVVFEGTYDDFQYNVSKKRQETMNAHLFGELLNKETLEKMPKEDEWKEIRDKLIKFAPDFSPPIG